jgi:predicted RNA-binding protein YlqC (UPF0109 family)
MSGGGSGGASRPGSSMFEEPDFSRGGPPGGSGGTAAGASGGEGGSASDPGGPGLSTENENDPAYVDELDEEGTEDPDDLDDEVVDGAGAPGDDDDDDDDDDDEDDDDLDDDEDDDDLDDDEDDDDEDDDDLAGELDSAGGAENRLTGGAARAVLQHVARTLVEDPDSIAVEVTEGRSGLRFSVRVARGDMGRIIGRRGRTAQALRTLVRAAAASEGTDASVDIVD